MTEETQVSNEVVNEAVPEIIFNVEKLPKHKYVITEFNPKTDMAAVVFPDNDNYTVNVQIPRLPSDELLTGEPLDHFIWSLLPVKIEINRGKEALNSSAILAMVKPIENNQNIFDVSDSTDKMGILRAHRDSLLNESDWTVMPDSPLSDDLKKKWIRYRKDLRDLPQRYVDVDLNKVKVEYPIPPQG
jgi:hypothetical protein